MPHATAKLRLTGAALLVPWKKHTQIEIVVYLIQMYLIHQPEPILERALSFWNFSPVILKHFYQ